MSSFRFIFLFIIAMIGMSLGIHYHFNQKQKIKIKKKTKVEVADVMALSPGLIAKNVKFPIFEYGQLTAEICAEEASWHSDKPIKLVKPILREFKPGTNKVTTEMTGDKGEFNIDISTKTIKNMNIKGNVKVKTFSIEEVEP